ncbi:MAG TPA: BTAD domain-containing putative transcriptional regulator [Rhizomicrobium sp.]|nr:BTAD domain-containing putative transcriptional regulator [Rhizomicrobium sp.]
MEQSARPSARWSLHLLGGFELSSLPGGQKVSLPGKRERALLAYLALSPKGRQPRRKLAALLWGDARDETLLDNLRTCVWRLRKTIGDTDHRLLASDEEDIVLDIAAFDVDVLAFRRLAEKASRAELEAAANLCSGEFLNGLELDSEEFESWRRLETSRHLDQALETLSHLMRLLIQDGQSERAIDIGVQILGLDPLHEATARHLMQLYADSGRRGAAIQLYRTLTDALHRDVNTQPAAETQRAFARIAHTDEVKALAPGTSGEPGQVAEPAAVAEGREQGVPKPARRLRYSMATLVVSFIAATVLGSSLRIHDQPDGAGIGTVQARASVRPAPTAIAVLPFDNLSGDPTQQFFSDGMTEEISTALAKVPGLELIARTSAYRLKGNKDARQVGAALGAPYLLEGAVRKTNDRVRITAQLVRTDTGRLAWSDTYERQLTDVFAIQEDIAKAIAAQMRLSIALPSGENLVPSRDIDASDYEQFLRVKPFIRARQAGVEKAIQILEPLVARNPNFAPAWALLAQEYAIMPGHASPYTTMPDRPDLLQRRYLIETYRPKAEAAARRAIQLDPRLPGGYYAFGLLLHHSGKLAMAEDLYAKALALDPYNPETLELQANFLSDVGETKKATEIEKRVVALDPYVPNLKVAAAELLWDAGQKNRANTVLMSMMENPNAPVALAMNYAADGRYAEAADALEAGMKARGELPQNQAPQWQAAATFLRTAPAKVPAGQHLPILGRMDWVYLYVGAPEQALEHYESDVRTGMFGGPAVFSWLWKPAYAFVRKTARFKALMINSGRVEYWRQRGWPDFCHPLGSTDFECV